jgi:peptidoglycan LD-endopeptidase LytH
MPGAPIVSHFRKPIYANGFCNLVLFLCLGFGFAQTTTCTFEEEPPQTEEERQRRVRSEIYRRMAGYYASLLPAEPDETLLIPVEGVRVSEIADTWGAPRGGGRLHEGQDMFAAAGTAIYSATNGFVYRIDVTTLGGNVIWIAGAGGRRYYYAHLQDWGDVQEGQYVDTNTVIGYVGNTGNAITTPPHLHFGIYSGFRQTCNRMVYDPLPLLVNR